MKPKELIGKDVTFFEAAIDEEILLASESLLDAKAVYGNTPESTSIPWDLTIKDQNFHYQVKVQLKGEKIETFSCSCIKFSKGELCSHVTSGLIYVRKNESTKSDSKNSNNTKRRISVSAKKTVEHMTHSDLKQFVLDYSKKDALFRLLLLARQFATIDSEERERIIERSFPVITKVDQKISARSVNSFITINEEIFPIITDLLATENYIEAYDIIQILLKKSFYIKSKLAAMNLRFLQNHNTLINYFHDIHDIIEAPEFKESIHSQIVDLISASYISANTEEEKKLWFLIYHQTSLRDKLKVVVQENLNKGKDDDLESYYFMLMLSLLMTPPNDLHGLLKSLDSQSSYRVIQLLMQHDTVVGVENVLYEFVMNTSVSALLSKQMLAHLNPIEVSSELENRIMQLFAKNGEVFYLEWLLKHSSDPKRMLTTIEKLMSDNTSDDLRIQYYLFINRSDDAMAILINKPNKTLLMKYDVLLIPSHPDAILQVYKAICTDYVSSHFGGSSRDFMIEIYQHLTKIGAHKIKNKLQSFVKAEFTNRQSLNV